MDARSQIDSGALAVAAFRKSHYKCLQTVAQVYTFYVSEQSPRGSLAGALRAAGVASYSRRDGRGQVVFDRLREVSAALQTLVPGHYRVPISQGVGQLPVGLWVAVLDPDVTDTPTKGIYIVYLFDEDRSSVTLSLNQGVTAAAAPARSRGMTQKALLRSEAMRLRSVLAERGDGLDQDLHLGRSGLLPAYEAGNVLGRRYEIASMPSSQALEEDLERFLDLYAFVVLAAEDRRRRGVGDIELPPRNPDVAVPLVDVRFEPKDASDYRAHIAEHEQIRSRSHEDLLKRLGEWCRECGYNPNTNVHPRDLVLHKPGQPDVLVEVKIFAAGRPREAIRSAIGQLFEYRRFLSSENTLLLMCLPADPEGAYRELLTSLGISAIWPRGSSWEGTPGTAKLGLLTS